MTSPFQVDQNSEAYKTPDYAELKDPPPRQSVLQAGFSSEGVKSGSVSRTKFDLVKDKLKSVQVELQGVWGGGRWWSGGRDGGGGRDGVVFPRGPDQILTPVWPHPSIAPPTYYF